MTEIKNRVLFQVYLSSVALFSRLIQGVEDNGIWITDIKLPKKKKIIKQYLGWMIFLSQAKISFKRQFSVCKYTICKKKKNQNILKIAYENNWLKNDHFYFTNEIFLDWKRYWYYFYVLWIQWNWNLWPFLVQEQMEINSCGRQSTNFNQKP